MNGSTAADGFPELSHYVFSYRSVFLSLEGSVGNLQRELGYWTVRKSVILESDSSSRTDSKPNLMNDDTTKPTRGRPKTFDRAKTLNVAVESYWRDGVDGVSINEICRRAQVSKPGLYREFGGEDKLMNAALDEYARTVLRQTLQLFEVDRPFLEAVRELVRSATSDRQAGRPAGCLFAKMRSARPQLGEATKQRVDRLTEEMRTAYAKWLSRAARRGEITLPVGLAAATDYVDHQLQLAARRVASGDDPGAIRDQTELAFSVFSPSTA